MTSEGLKQLLLQANQKLVAFHIQCDRRDVEGVPFVDLQYRLNAAIQELSYREPSYTPPAADGAGTVYTAFQIKELRERVQLLEQEKKHLGVENTANARAAKGYRNLILDIVKLSRE